MYINFFCSGLFFYISSCVCGEILFFRSYCCCWSVVAACQGLSLASGWSWNLLQKRGEEMVHMCISSGCIFAIYSRKKTSPIADIIMRRRRAAATFALWPSCRMRFREIPSPQDLPHLQYSAWSYLEVTQRALNFAPHIPCRPPSASVSDCVL